MTSAPVFVRPQAMRLLWPMMTNGVPGKRHAGDVESRRDQMRLVPDRGHLDVEVRIVGEQRPSRGGPRAGDDPAVAAAGAGGDVEPLEAGRHRRRLEARDWRARAESRGGRRRRLDARSCPGRSPAYPAAADPSACWPLARQLRDRAGREPARRADFRRAATPGGARPPVNPPASRARASGAAAETRGAGPTAPSPPSPHSRLRHTARAPSGQRVWQSATLPRQLAAVPAPGSRLSARTVAAPKISDSRPPVARR